MAPDFNSTRTRSPAVLILIGSLVRLSRKAMDLGSTAAQLVIRVFCSHTQQGGRDAEIVLKSGPELLPGFGELISVRLPASSKAIGESLGTLNLRGQTGATVLAVVRHGAVVAASAKEVLNSGDILLFVGTNEAAEEVRRLLSSSS